MGKLSRGYLGGFQGQLGTAYGCFWRLMDLVKAMPRKVKRAPTEAQSGVQLRLALVMTLLKSLKQIIQIGFKQSTPNGQSTMNAAVSYNIKNAIGGIAPDFTVDFSKLMFSQGELPKPYNFNVVADTAAKLKFTWDESELGTEGHKPTDKVAFVVYNPAKGKYAVQHGAIERSALEYTLQLPPTFSGDTVQCYMSFYNATRTMASENVHKPDIVVL